VRCFVLVIAALAVQASGSVGAVLRAKDASVPCVEVRVYDTADTPRVDMNAAHDAVAKVFGTAGIEIDWLACPAFLPMGRCASVPPPSTVLVRIVAQPSPVKNVLGDSLVDYVSHRGTLATLYAVNVRAMADRTHTSAGSLLGFAMAHEIGHVLRGSLDHSASGLMRPHWYDDDLLRNEQADWVLTDADAREMRGAALARGVSADTLRAN
jgi:hypothetical protein